MTNDPVRVYYDADADRGRLGDGPHVEPRRLGAGPGAASLPETHQHLGSAVSKIEGMGMALAAVPDDRKGAAGQTPTVGVGIVVHAHGKVGHDSVSR